MKENLYEIIKDFSKEKGLDYEVVKKLVEQSLIQAAQRKLPYQEIEGQIDDCVSVNQITNNIFGKTNQYYKDYVLEVSSPGIFRKLKTPDHFKSFTGKRIKVHLEEKIEGLMTVTGELQKCNEETICIQPDTNNSDIIIPYSLISRANLEPLLKF